MARTSLPPGYRFHPTDAELVMYYLKRKVMGKKFRLESIAEVNIYQFSPWDLPDKSCSKSRDLEWFFFCPTEKKYASGVRVNRATENGFWKTTGKDRSIHNNDKLVGTVKTLIFHLGHAPKGKRTDWVIHEYKILDTQLAAAGMQDTYVLCKVFKKNGPGPKNGAQYGAPFNEADWSDDDDDAAENHAISLASDGPLPTTLLQTEEQSCLPATGLFGPGNKSGLSLIEGQLTSASHPASEVVVDETDDVLMHLIASLTDDDMMLCNENGINQDERSGKGKNLPCADGISKNLGDLNSWSWMNSRTQADENSLKNNPLLVNSAYIELDDFGALLDYPAGLTENGQSSVSGMHMSHMHWNIQQSDPEASSSGVDQYPARTNQFPLLPEGTYDGDNCFDLLQVNSSLNQEGCNASYDLDFVFGRLDNGINSAQDMERVISTQGTVRTWQFQKEQNAFCKIPSRMQHALQNWGLNL